MAKGTKKEETQEVILTSEVDFLKTILRVQKDGGFGNHLNDLILERVKEIEGHETAWIDNGEIVTPKSLEVPEVTEETK